jgi:predicted Rossmann fold nucleotide-binding protein DprA/Smf involved in DNA uptake
VFAVPGNVTNKNSWGPNTLIQQGAVLVATWEDVGEELPTRTYDRLWLRPPRLNPRTIPPHLYSETQGLPPLEKRILSLLKADEATHIDEIASLRSASELEYHLLWARDLQFLAVDEFKALEAKILEVQRVLTSFVQRLQRPVLARS